MTLKGDACLHSMESKFLCSTTRRSLIRSVADISCVKVRSSETSCQIRRSNVMEQQSRAQICPAIDGLYGDASPVIRHYRMLIFFPGLIRHARHHFLQEIAYGDMVRLVQGKPVIPYLFVIIGQFRCFTPFSVDDSRSSGSSVKRVLAAPDLTLAVTITCRTSLREVLRMISSIKR